MSRGKPKTKPKTKRITTKARDAAAGRDILREKLKKAGGLAPAGAKRPTEPRRESSLTSPFYQPQLPNMPPPIPPMTLPTPSRPPAQRPINADRVLVNCNVRLDEFVINQADELAGLLSDPIRTVVRAEVLRRAVVIGIDLMFRERKSIHPAT